MDTQRGSEFECLHFFNVETFISLSSRTVITVDFTQVCQSMTAVNHTSSDNCKRAKGSTEISDNWRTFGICIIAVGMILQGIAKSPRQSYIGIYVDDNVPKSKTAVYLGSTKTQYIL